MTETPYPYQYQYQFGDRPLEGYTIQRAVGRGGFGEVYFAISDSGRQVALKVIQNYEQIELRGIKQCMNLKNPHLVTIFDVKHNDKGRPFVIMEYVSGLSLRDLMDESPGGLGPQKAAFFLREIAKGLSFLHDCGIVHRDLKPSNIFFENGCVKIGDYGLTKAISTSHASEQTVTVGTVQYMAPEIGQGRYDFSIDIYALGIVLYEMLTGQVPFFGASPAEVLMKHLMDEPNLTGINEPFAHAIQKALVKDPALRYKTVQEMAEDVFGPEHIRDSVSQFRPEELSVIAQHVAAKVRAQSQASEQPTRPSGPKEKDRSSGMAQMGEQIGHKIGSAGDRIAEGLAGATSGLERRLSRKANGPDAIGRRQRLILAIVIMAVISLAVGLFRGAWRDGDFTVALVVFLMMAGLVKGILWAEYRLLEGLEQGPFRNCLAAGLGILVAAVVAGLGGGIAGWTLLSLLVLVFVNWRRVSAPDRARQIDWAPVVWAGVIGGLVALPEGQPLVSVGLIAGTILAVQVVSPFGGGASAAVETGPPPSVPDTPSPTPTPPAPASVPGPEEEDQPADPQALPATSLTPETTVPASGPEETPMNGQSATSAPRSNNQASVVAVQARPPRPRSVLAGLSAFIGYLLLIVGLLIGLLFSLHVILFASAVDQGLARDFEQEMGSDWPYLVELIGGFVTGLFLILALIFLILARRRRGVSHLIRAVAGIAILAVFLFCLFYATPGRLLVVSPTFQAGTGQPGPVLAQALRAVQIPYLIGSLVALIGGVTVLAWPAGDRQSRPDLPVYNRAADPPCS